MSRFGCGDSKERRAVAQFRSSLLTVIERDGAGGRDAVGTPPDEDLAVSIMALSLCLRIATVPWLPELPVVLPK